MTGVSNHIGDGWRVSGELRRTDAAHVCPKPIDVGFYRELIAELPRLTWRDVTVVADQGGLAREVSAGEAVRLTLLEGPQIVNLFAFNRQDPDERIWHQTLVSDGLFATRLTRLWGTMARYRPLLTILDDTVVNRPIPSATCAHHPILGGSGTPADWTYAGGPKGVVTTWEQFAAMMSKRGLAPHLLTENVCLFQKTGIDPITQRLNIYPSDAMRGDSVTLFAEIDLCVLVALSPYLDGSRAPAELDEVVPKAVEVAVSESYATPLDWPYPGVPYPDLSLYLGEDGLRSDEPGPTPGLATEPPVAPSD